MDLRERTRKFLQRNQITQTEFSLAAGCSQPSLSRWLSGHNIGKEVEEKIEKLVAHPKATRVAYLLMIQKDGTVKYCHSYAKYAEPETIYFTGIDDEKMSVPYAFNTFRSAEWMFYQWRDRTGQKGWRYLIQEVTI